MKEARDPALIRQAMKARGDLSLRELSKLAGCTDGTISFILAGRPTNPELARAISRSLKRPLNDLFQDVPTSTAPPTNQLQRSA